MSEEREKYLRLMAQYDAERQKAEQRRKAQAGAGMNPGMQSQGSPNAAPGAGNRRESTGSAGREVSGTRQRAENARQNDGNPRQGGHSEAWLRAQKRKKKRARQRKRLMIMGAVLLVVLILIIRILAAIIGHFTGVKEKDGEPVYRSSKLSVNGIALKGMTKSEAKSAIQEANPWQVKISYNGEYMEAEDLTLTQLDAFLTQIMDQGETGELTFTVEENEELRSAAEAVAQDAASKWNVDAKNSSISQYDAESDTFLFTEGTDGIVIDQDSLTTALVEAAASGNYNTVITADATSTSPELSEDDAKAQYQQLSTFTTETTANEKRNTNVKLAAQAINGTIVQPGEEFSFNQVVGERTAEKGYQDAAAYSGGEVVQELGGGVCQVSSTMYRVAFQSGMEITYRRSHTFEPSYVTPGQDAAISWDLPDFRFINTSKAAIGIRANYYDRKMTVSFYGVPVLEEGVTWSLESEKTDELPPPDPTYVEDQTLDPGTEVTEKAASNGSRWVTYKIVSKNGEVVEKTEDHTKTYKGHAAVIRRNTGSVKVSPSETTVAPTTASPTVDGMPDGYVPGDEVAPESSAAATKASETKTAESLASETTKAQESSTEAKTGTSETKTKETKAKETTASRAETKASQTSTTAAPTTAASTTAASTTAAAVTETATETSASAGSTNGPGYESGASASTEEIGNIIGFPGN